MIDNGIILLIGCTHQQRDYWKKAIFSYEEIQTLPILEIQASRDIHGYSDGWYILAGEWEKHPHIEQIFRELKTRGFKELELLFEEYNSAV